jgi:hypothetical protein
LHPQEDLIGHEQEGRHDEKRRAALHAAWLEQQDNAHVEQLLHGVQNGFRKRRNALDDEVSLHVHGPSHLQPSPMSTEQNSPMVMALPSQLRHEEWTNGQKTLPQRPQYEMTSLGWWYRVATTMMQPCGALR